MSVKSGIAEIRAARKLVLTGGDPFSWEVLSTDGSYKHHLVYDEDRLDIACLTCEAQYHSGRCWARQRCIDDLEQRFGKGRPPKAPETPVEAIGSMSWREVFAAATQERRTA
jgi:hypothetical protein